MNKVYSRINWENEPSANTPINEANLNKMDYAVDELDNRLIAQDTSKADKTEVSTLIANVEFDESTGIITVTRKNGSSFTIDTKLEKIAINFTYDKDTQKIILTLIDGTKQYIDLSALITQYEFLDSDTITFVVQSDGKIKAEVLDGSITENKLQSNYLAQIKVETAKSQTYMNNASSSATQAKSYAVGGTGTREGEDNDNAKYYYQQAKNTDIGQLRQDVDEINRKLSSLCYPNAGSHNAIYRGKYLGNSVTDEQWTEISNGTFNDLFIGDYWKINGVNWRIASFDYWLNCGYTQCTKHHVVIVPDSCLYVAQMNTTNVTTGAYIGSEMYKTNLEQAKTTINNAFGSSHILSHGEYLANATKSTEDPTYESANSWYDSTVELMNERMVYGADAFHNIEVNGAIPTNYTIDKCQLSLFALEPSRICNRVDWWLRDVVSAAYFAGVGKGGSAGCSFASSHFGVRPAFGITVN